MRQEIPGFYFATGSSSFKMGDYGFISDAAVSIYATQNQGSIITTAIREVTFYNPGISALYIGGEKVPEKESAEGWIKVDIPQRTHQFAFNTPFVSVLDEMKVSENLDVILYPNPAGNYIMISLKTDQAVKGSIHVYNILGQSILGKDLTCTRGVDIRLDISEWNSGTYLAQVNLGRKVVYKKLIVTK